MPNRLVAGALAGAAGTLALDVATYLDMSVRGRPPSEIPAEAAERLARQVGLPLKQDERADNQKTGLGALLGYATGVSIGTAYRAIAGRRKLPKVPAGVVLGLAAMVAADAPLVSLGLTDPRSWGVSGWLSDLVPHLVYGMLTVAALDAANDPARAH